MSIRKRLSLDGTWQFWPDPEARLVPDLLAAAPARSITVPAPWQAQFDDLRYYTGTAWYRCQLEVPAEWLAHRLFLRFGAVDYLADIWFNEVHVGEHEGGYLPFELDVTHAARPGANMLTVRVTDPGNLFPEIPHGKQSWYGPLSGIWQSVWLEQRAEVHLRSARLYPELSTGVVRLQPIFSGVVDTGYTLVAEVVAPGEKLVTTANFPLAAGADASTLTFTVPEVLPWSPDTPNLYRLHLHLLHDDQAQDTISEHFGFRTIETRNGMLFLNGRPLYLRGALDQDYYPGTIAIPPSLEFLENQFHKAKALGLNCLRCHIKVPDPRYYETADRLGMLIWTELPNWHALTERSTRLARSTLHGILERDGNHPSIIAWTIVNEDWGLELMNDPSHRAWLKESYRWLKQLDPSRLVIDNSPCLGNFHVQTDVNDYHYYTAIPDHRYEWDAFINSFAGRLAPTFSPYGDAVQTGQEPLIVSEFGNWGLPDVEKLMDNEGREPWWFETGLEWSEGVVYPSGVRQRFRRWHLDRVFGSWQTLVEATQWQEFYSLKYEIEAIRRRPEINGYVITELTDVHWECNGLLDMERNSKVFETALATLNADTALVPEWEQTAYWEGELVPVRLSVAHGAGPAIKAAEVEWTLAGIGGRVPVPALQAGEVWSPGVINIPAPNVDGPAIHRLELILRSKAGDELATNHLPLAVFPLWAGPTHPDVRLWMPQQYLVNRLLASGYRAAARPEEADVLLVDKMTPAVVNFLREGGHVLLLADRVDALGPGLLGVNVASRRGTAWQGDWASSFAWLRRHGPFARIPGGPLLDYSFDRIMPDFVLTGFGPWDFESQVHAGLFVGWLHKPVALIGERRYGKGHLVACTFRLIPGLFSGDPVAISLLDSLIELVRQ